MEDARIVVAAHASTAADVCAALDTDPSIGLSDAEAAARLSRHGANVLAQAPPVPRWRKILAQFASPLVLLLLAAAAVSLAVWAIEVREGAPHEAITILAIVALNAALGFYQEERAERAVAGLSRISAASALVVRAGERRTIPAADLVPGDVLLVEEGMTIAADARVIESVSLRTAEAALTGESAGVDKLGRAVAADTPLAERIDMLFAGTVAIFGRGRAVVTATGMSTEFGRIAALLEATVPEPTPLQRELDRLGKVLGAVVIAIAIYVAATILLMQRDITAAVLVGVLLYTVSLAVSAVPEGLAAVTTVVLSLGMQRMARRNAIVRHLSAVETLGAATVIASDKTGTLTQNEMTVRAIVTASGRVDVSGSGYAPEGELRTNGFALTPGPLRTEVRRLLAAGYLASNADLVVRDGRVVVMGDPTEGALKTAARKAGLAHESMTGRFSRTGELPFTAERRLMSVAHADARDAGTHVLFVKGAPDVLLARCTHERIGNREVALGDTRHGAIVAAVDSLAGDALRTLGLAYRRLPTDARTALHVRHEDALVWLGVVGMIDPPRPEAAAAVAAARRAGLRVLMITGDHPAAAGAIAAELGIAQRGDPVLTGAGLAAMDRAALVDAVRTAAVFARVAPEHKLAIVRALQSDGEVVAMTGDGVNDAPALKAADIGIAMGLAGTDVSREAADMVLADDNFATIVAAIEEGRSIYANIQKFLRYLLATNLGEVVVMFFGVAGAGALGLVAGPGEALTLPLLATMILWINLVTDGAPALALGVDPAEPRLMERRPRSPQAGVITPRMWAGIAIAAVVIGSGTLILLDAGLPGGLIDGTGDVTHARTMAFNVLVLYQLVNAPCARSDEVSAFAGFFANRWLWASIAIGLAMQAAVIYLPSLQKGFGTVGLSAGDWALCAAVAASVLVAQEATKAIFRARDHRRVPSN